MRDHNHSIHVGNNNVRRVDFDPGTIHGNVLSGKTIVIHGCGGDNATTKNGKLQSGDLGSISNTPVDNRPGEAAIFHGSTHQPADSGIIQAVLEHHHID